MTNFQKLYQDYGEYNVLFNQLNLPSPSVEYAWRKIKNTIDTHTQKIIDDSTAKIIIADIGCGNGATLLRLAKVNQNNPLVTFHGYDFSPAFVKYGNDAAKYKHLANIKFFPLNLETDNLSQKYNIIICSEVLEHLHQPTDILQKLRLSLFKNGYLILTTPNSKNLIKYPFFFLKQAISRFDSKEISRSLTLEEQNHKLAEIEQHLYVFSQGELHQTLNKIGFKVLDTPRSTTLFGGPFLDNHSVLFAITIIFDMFFDLFPIPQLGWDCMFILQKQVLAKP